MSATDNLLRNNQAYAAEFGAGGAPTRPALGVAVVACMDARVDVYRLLGLTEGDAHVIRNAGGVVTEDVIRSLIISQRLLGTTEIVLVHHTGCGMLSFQDDAVKDEIEAESGVRPAFALESFPDLDGDVLESLARIQASPFIAHKNVRGFVYDVTDGRLREVLP